MRSRRTYPEEIGILRCRHSLDGSVSDNNFHGSDLVNDQSPAAREEAESTVACVSTNPAWSSQVSFIAVDRLEADSHVWAHSIGHGTALST